jgi:putative ABC transport system substrate-binding protein
MRQRYLGLFCAFVILSPLALSAQTPSSKPIIGFLNSASPGPFAPLVAKFKEGLEKGGFVEGQNVEIEYQWAEGRYERLPQLAAQLVRRNVSVITATGGVVSARAAKGATSTIPIVFLGGTDPAAEGLVSSISHPGGNITGASTYTTVAAPKRVQYLKDMLPNLRKVALLMNPDNPIGDDLRDLAKPGGLPGFEAILVKAQTERDFERAFQEIVDARADAMLVSSDPFFTSRRTALVALAARHRIPAGYAWREYARAGGLLSYGTNLPDSYKDVGEYTAKILKGAKPGDLPILFPRSFFLSINTTTAKNLGLTISRRIVVDELLE